MRRIAIIGGGFAGVTAAQVLQQKLNTMKSLELVLFSSQSHFFSAQHRFDILTGKKELRQITSPLSKLLKKPIQIRVNDIERISPEEHLLYIKDPISSAQNTFVYDYAIVATGSTTHWRGIENHSEYAFGVKSPADFFRIREHILKQLQHAKQLYFDGSEIEEIKAHLRFIVIGAGPTGSTLAATLNTFLKKDSLLDLPAELRPEIEIILVDADDRPVTEFPVLSDPVQSELLKNDIQLLFNQKVTNLDGDTVSFEDHAPIRAQNIFWCGGVKRRDFFDDPPGRITDPTLRHLRFSDVFIAGDYADDLPIAMNAHCAIAQGRLTANNLIANLSGRSTNRWTYPRRAFILDLGGTYLGLGENGTLLRGRSAKLRAKSERAKLFKIWRGNRTEGFKQIIHKLMEQDSL